MYKTVNGIRINYEEKGEGELIVLLHGWGSNIRLFANLIALLSRKYKVVAMDMPGFGESQEPPAAWDVSDYVQFVVDFLSDYSDKKIMFLGHSFGGRVIIKLNSRGDLPFEVSKVILVDSAGILPPKTNKKSWRTRWYKMGKAVLDKACTAYCARRSRKLPQENGKRRLRRSLSADETGACQDRQ